MIQITETFVSCLLVLTIRNKVSAPALMLTLLIWPFTTAECNMFKKIMLLIGMMLLLAITSFTQIQGDVADWKDKGVPNASIIAIDTVRKVADTVKTDERGFYEFKGLKPGAYKVEAKASGFRPVVHKTVVVKEGDTGTVAGEEDLYRGIRLDITLRNEVDPNQIEGKVANQKEKGMPNVTVTATDSIGKLVATVKSDELGFYAFKNLRPGKYKIETKASGFRPATHRIEVKEGESEEELVDINQGKWLYIVLIPVKAFN